MPHLVRVDRRPGEWPEEDFPFSVPSVRSLQGLDLSAPVTLFVGENGSGKSTLLEGIAAAAELPTIGGAEIATDDSLAAQRALGSALRLTWTRRTRQGFYLRAEDFFGYLKRLARDRARMARERRELGLKERPPEREDEWRSGVHVDEEAAAPFLAEYDARSHGESFLDVFTSRLHGGLYLLDEPETPLSPQRQLALLAILVEAVYEGAQFVIATHSPILLAFPGARIYGFDSPPIREVEYDELEHVTVMRDFLVSPERFLRHLRGGGPDE